MLDHEESVHGVRIMRWNPERPDGLTGELSRVNNFGDLLGPLLVERLLTRMLSAVAVEGAPRLLGLGSVLHLAEDGDVVWGSGVNGKIPVSEITASKLDIRAVRGPRTREILRSLGHDVPETYGDPALLLNTLFPEMARWARVKSRGVTVVPNFNDFADLDDPRVVSPRSDLMSVIRAIAGSEFVVGSSLHAIIVAEALGVPARACLSKHENYLKYVDYYAGTGRTQVKLARTVEEAIRLGGVREGEIDETALLASFPADLWTGYKPLTLAVSLASAEDRTREWDREVVTIADLGWEVQAYEDSPQVKLEALFTTRLVQPLLNVGASMPPDTFQTVVSAGAAFLNDHPSLTTTTNDATRAILEDCLRQGDASGIRRLLVLQERGAVGEVRVVGADDDSMTLFGLLHLSRPDSGLCGAKLRLASEVGGLVLDFPSIQMSPLAPDGSVWRWNAQISLDAIQEAPEGMWSAALVVTGTAGEEIGVRLRSRQAVLPVDVGRSSGSRMHTAHTLEEFFVLNIVPQLPKGAVR